MQKNEKIVITPLAYIRGRSLSDIIFIVDEAQNLTPHEVKTIITRAGENTKIVFTGDVRQIDTPYLDEESNGLTYIIDRLKGSDLFAHMTLSKGERSELANLAAGMAQVTSLLGECSSLMKILTTHRRISAWPPLT